MMGCLSAPTADQWISELKLMMMGGDTLNAANVKCERQNIAMTNSCAGDGIPEMATSTPLTTTSKMQWSAQMDFKTQILTVIERCGGATNAMIRKQTGMTNRASVTGYLIELEGMGFIIKEESVSHGRRCFKYFLNPDNTALDLAIQTYLEANPGRKSKQIAEAVGINYTIIKARMRYLASIGQVDREMLPGGAWKYYWQEIIPFGMSRDRMMFEKLLAGARQSCGQ